MINMRDIARAGHVTRWHSVRTAREQTLAEHQYQVAMIARELCARMIPQASDSERLTLLEYCLVHDVPELLTGDIPSPMKRRLEHMLASPEALAVLEASLYPPLKVLQTKLYGTAYEAIARIADYIDAIVFIAEEGIGTHATVVRHKLEFSLNDYIERVSRVFDGYDWRVPAQLLAQMRQGNISQIEFENV